MDNINKILFSLIGILPLTLNGKGIDLHDASNIAREFVLEWKNPKSRSYEVDPLLVYQSLKNMNNIPYLYVFNIDGGGYVIVSGNDYGEKILGYSYNGAVDDRQLPENMKLWLDQYEQEIDYLYKFPQHTESKDAPTSDYAPISPLLSTNWDQGFPYNKFCPVSPGETEPCITGCVATAMAQIMNYHKWPMQGTGTHSYTRWGQELSIDFTNIAFDWADMLSTYTSGNYGTQEEQDAVAMLMKCCGYSVDMLYSPGLSISYDNKVINALYKYFDYDADMKLLSRRHYYSEEWEEMIYNELSHNRPLYYSGSGSGGHAFVCDGYDSNGYFHFNWGWNGYCDGYFKLSALFPDGIGSGGSDGGYNYSQAVISGIKKKENENPMNTMLLGKIMDIGGAVTIYYDNPHPTDVVASYGLKVVKEYTNDVTYLQGKDFKIDAGNYGTESFDISDINLPNGKYKVYPVFKPLGKPTWIEFKLDPGCQKFAILEINDGEKTFIDPLNGDYPDIRVSSIKFNNAIYEYSSTEIDLELFNSDNVDLVNNITSNIYRREGSEIVYQNQLNIEVLSNETRRITKKIEMPLPKGEYEIQFTDIKGKTISEKMPFTIHSDEDIIKIDGLWCIIESRIDKTISVIRHPELNYSGDIYIPKMLNYNSVEYNIKDVKRNCFEGCKDITSICMDFSGWTEIKDWEFEGFNKLRKIILSEGIIEIGNYAFSGCNELDTVHIPESVIKIGSNAFAETNLKDIEIPDNVVYIGNWGFGACNNIENIKIGKRVETIGYSAFQNAEKLTDIILPESIKELGRDIFMSSNLTEIISLNPEPPILGIGDEIGFSFNDYTHDSCLLKIPEGSLSRYINAYEWNLFKNIVEIESSGISHIGEDKNPPFVISDKNIHFSNTDIGIVTIYNHLGQLVYSGENQVVTFRESGLHYIVVGKKSYKVLIK